MKFYIIKSAVYLHGFYGPYDSREDALAAFDKAYEAHTGRDFDGHHDYCIVRGLTAKIGFEPDGLGVDTIKYIPKRRAARSTM
jgi:hypothetical protein